MGDDVCGRGFTFKTEVPPMLIDIFTVNNLKLKENVQNSDFRIRDYAACCCGTDFGRMNSSAAMIFC